MNSAHDRHSSGPLLAALLIGAAAVAAAFYLRPFEASPGAGLLDSDATVCVQRRSFGIAFLPQAAPRRLGLAFYQAARVPPEAYAYLGHAAAASGYTAVLLSSPLNISSLAPCSLDRAMTAFPNIQSWVLAGDGAGGSWAASQLSSREGRVAGLILLDSLPRLDLSASRLAVLSLSASARGGEPLSSSGRLPASTRFVEISGGSEAQFGEYETGSAQVAASLPAAAQRRAGAEEILAFLNRVASAPRKED
jgi:hypothetical protein